LLKVLVSDKHTQENHNFCAYLANDKSLKIVSTYTGLSTLNTYYEINPDILVINSDFDDMTYTEIINKLCSTSRERIKSNIIITIKNENENLKLNFASKLYKLLYYPLDYEKIKEGIEYYKIDHRFSGIPTYKNLDILFYQLHIQNDLTGAKYLKFAIKECYKNPNLKNSLNEIYKMTSKKYNVSPISIRSAMRHTLKLFNKYKESLRNKGILTLFEDEDFVTPKVFIKIITDYYLQ